MNLISLLVGLFTLLAGGIFYSLFKKPSEVLQKNQDVKNQVAILNNEILNNSQQLANEEAKRTQIEEDLKKKENEDVTKDDLLDFVNKPSDSNSK